MKTILVVLDFIIPKIQLCYFIVLRFEKLGLELDNRGQTAKSNQSCIYIVHGLPIVPNFSQSSSSLAHS